MPRIYAIAIGLSALCSAGCRESADAIARDWRNINNEAVDALMQSTDESRATFLMERVVKPYADRMTDIKARTKNWVENRDNAEMADDMFNSDNVILLIVETPINARRLAREQARITALLNQLALEEQQRSGVLPDPSKAWPNLYAMTDEKSKVGQVTKELTAPANDLVKSIESIMKAELPKDVFVNPTQVVPPGGGWVLVWKSKFEAARKAEGKALEILRKSRFEERLRLIQSQHEAVMQ